jgi:hypothetical protein
MHVASPLFTHVAWTWLSMIGGALTASATFGIKALFVGKSLFNQAYDYVKGNQPPPKPTTITVEVAADVDPNIVTKIASGAIKPEIKTVYSFPGNPDQIPFKCGTTGASDSEDGSVRHFDLDLKDDDITLEKDITSSNAFSLSK